MQYYGNLPYKSRRDFRRFRFGLRTPTSKGITLEKLSKKTGIFGSKIDRFESSAHIDLESFMILANLLCPAIMNIILSSAKVEYSSEWCKNLKQTFANLLRSKGLTTLEVAHTSGVHLREVMRFERQGYIPLTSFFCLYKVVFEDFTFDEFLGFPLTVDFGINDWAFYDGATIANP